MKSSFLDPFRRMKHRVWGNGKAAAMSREHGRSRKQYVDSPLPHADELGKLFQADDALTILEIGACEGLDSIRYARAFPNATIHAFEPLAANVATFRRNLQEFGISNVHIHEIALSSESGISEFYPSRGAPEGLSNDTEWNFGNKSSSLLKPEMSKIKSTWSWLSFSTPMSVPTLSLSEFFSNHRLERISFMHMDVQGAEMKILEGAHGVLDKVDAIWLEVSSEEFYEGQALATTIAGFLSNNGFTRSAVLGTEPQWDELWVNEQIQNELTASFHQKTPNE